MGLRERLYSRERRDLLSRRAILRITRRAKQGLLKQLGYIEVCSTTGLAEMGKGASWPLLSVAASNQIAFPIPDFLLGPLFFVAVTLL
jgi:hypothetical protein